MVEYKCERCKKIFKKKDHYVTHMKRIKPCGEDINMNEYKCIYCGIKYSTKGSVTRHIKNGCDAYDAIENEKKQIFDELLRLKQENAAIMEEFKELKKELHKKQQHGGGNNGTTNNIINGNVNNGNINNITIIAFGRENIDKIDIKSILNAASQGYYATVRLTENVHFNPNNPEYHNVYIPSMNSSCAMVYDGSEWKIVSRKDVIDDLYSDKKEYIIENLEKFGESLSLSKIDALKRWLADDCATHVDVANIRKIKKEIGWLLYSKKEIPISSRKKQKKAKK